MKWGWMEEVFSAVEITCVSPVFSAKTKAVRMTHKAKEYMTDFVLHALGLEAVAV